MKVLTIESRRWDEFSARFEGPEGLAYKEDTGKYTNDCNCSIERPFATAILKKMRGIDVAGTLEYFEDHGGFCDCEILFNVYMHAYI